MNNIHILPTRERMGRVAATRVARELRFRLENQSVARMILAAAPSQSELYANLIRESGIDWSRVEVFHMDEYHTLPDTHPELFSRFIRTHFTNHVSVSRFEVIRTQVDDPEREARRYADLLMEAPIDICCLGIGENGHLAFNDPPVADFLDPLWVKEVELDLPCRLQQVHDAGFETISDVPETALTLTIPALMQARFWSVVVPGTRKARAVKNALEGPVSHECPASIIRNHPNAEVFLDLDAAALLKTNGAGKAD